MRDRVLATLAYYDGFDFPLSAREVLDFMVTFSHLGHHDTKTMHISDVKKELDLMVHAGILGVRDEMYYILDREYIVPLRSKREKICDKKIDRLIKITGWLRHVPFIKVVFASGSLGIKNASELSDLDIFVIVKNGYIWLARALMLLVFTLLGVRRFPSHKIAPDKMCANHYVTDKSLALRHKSIFTAQLYGNLKPVYVTDEKIIDRFVNENSWVRRFVNVFHIPHRIDKKEIKQSLLSKFLEFILSGKIGVMLNRWAKNYQIRSIQRNHRRFPQEHIGKGRIIYNDYQLEFHPSSVELGIIAKYNEKMVALGMPQYAHEKDSGLISGA